MIEGLFLWMNLLKMINQGMILGRSSFVYRIKGSNKYVNFEKEKSTKRLD